MQDTVLIFGARHLGRAIALHFAAKGANVAVVARTEREVVALAEEIEAAGGKGLAIPGDLRRREDTARAVSETVARFGALHLSVNAITPGARFGYRSFLELEDSDLEAGLTSTVWGAFRFFQEVGGYLARNGGGCLVQIGTSSGLRVREGFGALGAVQHALRALTIAAAKELRAARVHVAHLPCDGGIESAKTQNYLARVGPEKMIPQEEISRAVEYLYRQDPRAWTHELLLRPIGGDWTAPV